jgi:hypothetical protein
MTLRQPSLMSTELMTKFASGPVASGRPATGNARFAQVWAEVMPASASQVEVRQGDTLIGLVKAHHRQQGLPISETQAYRLAHQVAADNHIANPDLIEPGQKVDFARLNLPPLARETPAGPASPWSLPAAQQLSIKALSSPAPMGANPLPTGEVLSRVLERAVDKGYLEGSQLGAVRAKIGELAQRYNFEPDDFARLSLMESDGLNPQASNGRCHGIIQFCDGPNRGAAAVGMKNNPRAILGMGLLQQLDLVDRYFAQSGLPAAPPGAPKIGLDDLYLSILTPAARSEGRRDAPLPIPGIQSSWLHVGRNRQAPITRDSIVAGLQALADAALSPRSAQRSGARVYADVADTPPSP